MPPACTPASGLSVALVLLGGLSGVALAAWWVYGLIRDLESETARAAKEAERAEVASGMKGRAEERARELAARGEALERRNRALEAEVAALLAIVASLKIETEGADDAGASS